jgi:trans-2,3-dihydro-3-hydroxyanthranilate isomerase
MTIQVRPMREFELLQVDAFADQPLAGNPCAVVLDADGLDAQVMLGVAREMNLSETAFVTRSEVADFGVRYFTPAEEIPLAGHPTIATARALVDSGRVEPGRPRLTLELRVGPIEVDLEWRDQDLHRATMSQKRPAFLRVHAPDRVLPVFGLETGDLLPGAPIQTVSTGTPQLMVPLRGLDALRNAGIDHVAYAQLRDSGDFFSPHLFCLAGFTEDGDTAARHFGTPPDLVEDPFTGSATGGMAAYLWHHGLMATPTFVAEQGHWMGRPGRATVEVVGPPHDMTTVRVGGASVTVLRGRLTI